MTRERTNEHNHTVDISHGCARCILDARQASNNVEVSRIVRDNVDENGDYLDRVTYQSGGWEWVEGQTRAERALDVSGLDVDEAVQGYLETQLWVTRDEIWTAYADASEGYYLELSKLVAERVPVDELDRHGENLDYFYTLDEVGGAYVEAVEAEIREFAAAHPLAVRMYLAQRKRNEVDGSASAHFGHDLLLTRDHHGVGFWDRGLGELGEYLTERAERIGGSADLFDARLADEEHRTTEPLLIAS